MNVIISLSLTWFSSLFSTVDSEYLALSDDNSNDIIESVTESDESGWERAFERVRESNQVADPEREHEIELTELDDLYTDDNLQYEIFLQLEMLNDKLYTIGFETNSIDNSLLSIDYEVLNSIVPLLEEVSTKLDDLEVHNDEDNGSEVVASVNEIKDNVNYISNLLYLAITVFIPLVAVIILLWWFFKQFLSRWY